MGNVVPLTVKNATARRKIESECSRRTTERRPLLLLSPSLDRVDYQVLMKLWVVLPVVAAATIVSGSSDHHVAANLAKRYD